MKRVIIISFLFFVQSILAQNDTMSNSAILSGNSSITDTLHENVMDSNKVEDSVAIEEHQRVLVDTVAKGSLNQAEKSITVNKEPDSDSVNTLTQASYKAILDSVNNILIKSWSGVKFGLKVSSFHQFGKNYWQLAGFDAGVIMPIFLGDKMTGKGFALHPEVLFRKTSYNMYYTGEIVDLVKSVSGKDVKLFYKATLYYISIPFNFEYRFTPEYGLLLGPNFDIALGGDANKVSLDYNATHSDFRFGDKEKDDFNNKFNCSLNIGLVNYGKRGCSSLAYQIGFVDHATKGVKKVITNALSLSFGFHF